MSELSSASIVSMDTTLWLAARIMGREEMDELGEEMVMVTMEQEETAGVWMIDRTVCELSK